MPKRAFWRKLHLYAALVAMLPLAVTAATGVLLAYEPWLERWLEPRYFDVRDDGSDPLSPLEALARLREVAPLVTLHEVKVPEPGSARPYIAKASGDGPDGRRQWFTLYVDPYSGTVSRRDRAGPMSTVEHFHSTLMVGQAGRYWAGGSAFLLVLLAFVGLYLWWPLRRGTLRRFVRRRDALSWHQVLGLSSLPVVLIIAVTGVTITFYEKAIPLLAFATFSSPPPERPVIQNEDGARAGLSGAIRAVQARYPEARVTAYGEPRGVDQPYAISLRHPGEMHPDGWSEIFVHPGTLEVVGEFNAFSHSPATAYRHSFVFWHTGVMLGQTGRAVWSIVSLALLVLIATGLLQWLRRTRMRNATRRRV